MQYFDIKNESNITLDFGDIVKKIQPFCSLLDDSKFPIKITIRTKKHFLDRSYFNTETNEILLTFDKYNVDTHDANWVFAHEFAHFLANNNTELKRVTELNENQAIQMLLKKIFKLSDKDGVEIFHDFFPSEMFGNAFATMMVGKFYKRHPFSYPAETLKKIGIDVANYDDTGKRGEISPMTENKTKNVELTDALAKKIGEKLKVDFEKINFDDWKSGVKIEVEHKDIVNPGRTITISDWVKYGQIAHAHLKEHPKYYQALQKMEKNLSIKAEQGLRKMVRESINEILTDGEHLAGTIFTRPDKPRRKDINAVSPGGVTEKVKPETHIHTTGESQRQFVIDLARKNPAGLISLSDIALALNASHHDVRSYSRRIYHDPNRPIQDFVQVIPPVTFQQTAVYQLLDYHNRKPINPNSPEYIALEKDERKKYKLVDVNTVYYNIIRASGYKEGEVIGWISANKNDDVEELQKKLPAGLKLSTEPMQEQPKYGKEISLQNLSEIIRKVKGEQL